jgi:hypothetical protein
VTQYWSIAHVSPSPAYPLLHAHVNEPRVLLHVAVDAQLSVPAEHSSTSPQVGPAKPVIHAHVNEPTVLLHVASAWHALAFDVHSFTSTQGEPA